MHGLPVGIQVVGRWLGEEKVLAAMKRVEDALGHDKLKLLDHDRMYELLDLEILLQTSILESRCDELRCSSPSNALCNTYFSPV